MHNMHTTSAVSTPLPQYESVCIECIGRYCRYLQLYHYTQVLYVLDPRQLRRTKRAFIPPLAICNEAQSLFCIGRYMLYMQLYHYQYVLNVYRGIVHICSYITICWYCMHSQVCACIFRYLSSSTMTIPTYTDIYLHIMTYLHIVHRYCMSLCVGIILRYLRLQDTYRYGAHLFAYLQIPTNRFTDEYAPLNNLKFAKYHKFSKICHLRPGPTASERSGLRFY